MRYENAEAKRRLAAHGLQMVGGDGNDVLIGVAGSHRDDGNWWVHYSLPMSLPLPADAEAKWLRTPPVFKRGQALGGYTVTEANDDHVTLHRDGEFGGHTLWLTHELLAAIGARYKGTE